jgi:hypothetical protein
MSQVKLSGLDGRNLLGFLAAIGTFRVLAEGDRRLRLSWARHDYRPVLHLCNRTKASGQEELLDMLEECLRDMPRLPRFPWSDLTVKPEKFRAHARAALRSAAPGARLWIDFVAGLGSAAAPPDSKGNISDTALRTMSGAGHQHFLGFMKELQSKVSRSHLKEALFQPWNYADRKLSLRWDPQDDRRYALRPDNPSKGKHNEIPSMWGANRLAFEALAILPTYPTSRGLETTGFLPSARRRRKHLFHWPLWHPPITCDVLRSLLAHPAITNRRERDLRGLGVFALLSSRRFTEGRYRNFSPAEIWPLPSGEPRNQSHTDPA